MAVREIRQGWEYSGNNADARPTGIKTGCVYWVKDTDSKEIYDGDSWVQTSIGGSINTKITASDLTNPAERVDYVTITLDLTGANEYIIPDTEIYSFISFDMNDSGDGTGRVSVEFDRSEDQSGDYGGKVGFVDELISPYNTTVSVDFSTGNGYARNQVAASKVRFYVSTTGAGAGTATIEVMLKGQV